MTKRITHRPRKSAGRKSEYDEEVSLEICVRVMDGQSIREICRDPEMPSKTTVYQWMAVTPTFTDAYARACEVRAEAWADELKVIADDASNDWMERERQDGSVERVLDREHVQRSKLRIDTLKWLMSKHARRYADKVEVEVGGEFNVTNLSDAELVARTRARLEALGIEVATNTLLLGYDETAKAADDLQPVIGE